MGGTDAMGDPNANGAMDAPSARESWSSMGGRDATGSAWQSMTSTGSWDAMGGTDTMGDPNANGAMDAPSARESWSSMGGRDATGSAWQSMTSTGSMDAAGVQWGHGKYWSGETGMSGGHADPEQESFPANQKVWIGNIVEGVTIEDVQALCSQAGATPKAVKVNGTSGMLAFGTVLEAAEALIALSGSDCRGRPLEVDVWTDEGCP